MRADAAALVDPREHRALQRGRRLARAAQPGLSMSSLDVYELGLVGGRCLDGALEQRQDVGDWGERSLVHGEPARAGASIERGEQRRSGTPGLFLAQWLPRSGARAEVELRRTLVLGTILAMIGSAPSVGEDAADLLLRGGVFHTVSPAGRVAGTLAVRAGRIVYLGADPKAGNLLGARTQVIELGGRAVTPGLIDAHSHLLGLGRKLAEVDLAGTQSFEEVITRLRAKSREAAPGSWITGRGWDQSRWPENEFPRHAALSAAVPDHPVWVRRIDGHAGLANARALAIAGITADTLDPAGGKILRGERGEPTGVLIDNAMDLVAAHEPARSDEDFRALLRDA